MIIESPVRAMEVALAPEKSTGRMKGEAYLMNWSQRIMSGKKNQRLWNKVKFILRARFERWR